MCRECSRAELSCKGQKGPLVGPLAQGSAASQVQGAAAPVYM